MWLFLSGARACSRRGVRRRGRPAGPRPRVLQGPLRSGRCDGLRETAAAPGAAVTIGPLRKSLQTAGPAEGTGVCLGGGRYLTCATSCGIQTVHAWIQTWIQTVHACIRIIFTVQVIHCEFSYKLYGDPLWVSPAYLLRTHNMHPTLAGTGVCVSPFLPARYTPHTHGVSYRKGPCTVCSFTVCLCGYFCSDLHTAYARRILQEGGLSNASYTNVQYRHTNTVYVLYICVFRRVGWSVPVCAEVCAVVSITCPAAATTRPDLLLPGRWHR